MPTLGTVDYSSVANAIRGRGAAGQANFSEDFADLQKKEQQRQNVVGAIQGVIEVAGNVYGLLEQSKMEVGKQKLLKKNAETQQMIQEARLNGQIGIEQAEDGTYSLKVDDALKQAFEAQKAGLEDDKTFNGFGRVKQQLATSLTQMQETALTQAKEDITRQGIADGEAAYQQNLRTALDLSVNAEDVTGLYDTIHSNGMLTPAAKEADWTKAQKAYGLGLAEKKAAGDAIKNGLSAGLASIDQTEFSPEEKGTLQAAVYQADKSQTNYERDTGDKVITSAMEQSLPMGKVVEDYIGTLPEGRRQGVREYLDQKRDGVMWERFQKELNQPGANPQALYDRIKFNEPGGKAYDGHYKSAQVEQTRELNYLASILGIKEEDKKASTAELDKWAEDMIAGIKTKVTTQGMPIEDAVRILTSKEEGIYDANPTKANSAIAEIIKYKSPEYSEAYSGMARYASDIGKKYKMTPDQINTLESVLRDSVTAMFQDKPTLSSTDYAKAQNDLVVAMVGKGATLMTSLAKPGFFTDTNDGLGKYLYELESNPAISNALAYTSATFDRNNPKTATINPYARAKAEQLQGAGEEMIAKHLGITRDDVVTAFQREGDSDVSILPQFIARDSSGKERTFILSAPEKKLGLYEIVNGKKINVVISKVAPKGLEPVSDDFWSASEPQGGF